MSEIAIVHPQRNNEPLVIDSQDYMPTLHVLWKVRKAQLEADAAVQAARDAAAEREQRMQDAAAVSLEDRLQRAEALLVEEEKAQNPNPTPGWPAEEEKVEEEKPEEEQPTPVLVPEPTPMEEEQQNA